MRCFIYDDGQCKLTERVTMQVLFHTENGNVDLSCCLYAVIGFGSDISPLGSILFCSSSFERCAKKYASCVYELSQPVEPSSMIKREEIDLIGKDDT